MRGGRAPWLPDRVPARATLRSGTEADDDRRLRGSALDGRCHGGSGAGGGGATGHGGAGALTGPASSGFDSGDTSLTHRTWDEKGAHLTDQADQEAEILDAANDGDEEPGSAPGA